MIESPSLPLTTHCAQACAQAYAYHGDLSLNAADFELRLQQIVAQHLNPTTDAAFLLLEKLHTTDLYLTCACAIQSEAAWTRFLHLYGRYVNDVACYACGSVDLGQEVADFVLTDLCLLNRQGQRRIGSYDGRVPLRAWLRAIVVHHAYRERQRKYHQFKSLSEMPEFPDSLPVKRLEDRLRDHTYRELIIVALREAARQLSERERLILRLHYEEGLRGEEMARILKVSPSTISRSMQAAQQRFKAAVIISLTVKCNGQASDISECLIDLLENPTYSLLSLLDEAASV
ncbi:MAG: sigma-70 family RNA polymerase sigma factor [Acidobacteriota bacterium]|nr:sigma-70 family RNA polymerase sigma factor [Acidobacteriota bacterium]